MSEDEKKRDRALQRRVRERQQKTGESYQAAWRQLTDQPIEHEEAPFTRVATGLSQLDNILGGGLVSASVVLLVGPPGSGKTSLTLQMLAGLGHQCLYVTTEETREAVATMGERIGATSDRVYVSTERNLAKILVHAQELRAQTVAIDTIQKIFCEDVNSEAGNPKQLVASVDRMVQFAKTADTGFWLVGHVTNDGDIAGPRSIEHSVDVVLELELDRGEDFDGTEHIVRCRGKNRFGATAAVGRFTLTPKGFVPVTDNSLDMPATDDGARDATVQLADHQAQLMRINSQMFDGTIRVLGEQNKNLHEQLLALTAENARLAAELIAKEALAENPNPNASPEMTKGRLRLPLMLPLSTREEIRPHQPTRVTARATDGAVDIERIYVSNAGTAEGSADWVVNDIEIDGRSQLVHKDLPGALFGAGSGVGAGRATATLSLGGFDPVERDHELVLVVTYIGLNPEGCPFFGSALGSPPPQRPTILQVASKEPLQPAVKTTITARIQNASFQVHRLEIENSGTAGGCADWFVEDLRINGKTQFAQPGPIPGDLFATTALDSFVKLETCTAGNAIEIDMHYIGPNPQGAIFTAHFEGTVLRDDYTIAPPDLQATIETTGQGPAEAVVGRCNWRALATDNRTR